MTTAALLLALSAAPADTIPPDRTIPPTHRWTAIVSHRHESYAADAPSRRYTRLVLGRRVGRGALIGDVVRIDEPQGASLGGGVDVYTPLWRMAEGYGRVAAAPAALGTPDLVAGGAVMQHLGDAWHVGLSGWHRRVGGDARVDQGMLGVGWLRGRWSAHLRAGAIAAGDTRMATGHAIGRHALDGDRSFVEAVVMAGGEVFDITRQPGSDPVALTGRSWGVALHGQVGLPRNTALIVNAGFDQFHVFGSRTHLEAGLSVGW